jgi:hypothetical protein
MLVEVSYTLTYMSSTISMSIYILALHPWIINDHLMWDIVESIY